MLALNKIASGMGNLALQEVDVRQPNPGEMLIKIKASGLCGTDMSVYKGAGNLCSTYEFSNNFRT